MEDAITFNLPKLYKYGSRREVRVWYVVFEDENLITISGQQGGKMTQRASKIVPKAKRNLLQQAELEAKSRHKKKIDEGFRADLDEEDDQIPNPMSGQVFEERLINYPILVQCKLDGIRMLCRQSEDQLQTRSRRSQEIKFLETMKGEIKNYLNGASIILDGELYSLSLNFHKLSGVGRSKNAPSPHEEEVCYVVFDQLDLENPTLERLQGIGAPIHHWKDRETIKKKAILNEKGVDLAPFLRKVNTHLYLTRNWIVEDEQELKEIGKLAEDLQFEGLIVRHIEGPKALYLTRACSHLLKVKQYLDAEGVITGFSEGTGTEEGKVIWLVELLPATLKGVDTKPGEIVRMRPQGDFAQREDWFKNGDEYIGKIITYKCLEINKETGIPREPCVLRFREDI